MKMLLAALALIIASVCYADEPKYNLGFKNEDTGNAMLLSRAPCTLPQATLDHAVIPPAEQKKLRHAQVYFKGKVLNACYLTRNGWVRAIDEQGSFIKLLELDFSSVDGSSTTDYTK